MVLTDKDIEDIKRKKKDGQTMDSLAIEYEVSMSTIVRALHPEYRKKWAEWQREHYRKVHPRMSGKTIIVKPNEAFERFKELLDTMFDRGVPIPDLKITVRPIREK